MAGVLLEIHLVDVRNGKRYVTQTELGWREDDGTFNPFVLAEGNWSCDCNRFEWCPDAEEICLGDGFCAGAKFLMITEAFAVDEPDKLLYLERYNTKFGCYEHVYLDDMRPKIEPGPLNVVFNIDLDNTNDSWMEKFLDLKEDN